MPYFLGAAVGSCLTKLLAKTEYNFIKILALVFGPNDKFSLVIY